MSVADPPITIGKAFKKLTQKLFRYEPTKTPVIFIILFAATLLEGFGLALIIPLAALIFESGETDHPISQYSQTIMEQMGLQTLSEQLWFFIALYLFIIFCRAGLLLVRDKYLAVHKNGFINQERKHLYHLLAGAPWPVLSKLDRSNILNTLTYDLGRLGICVHFFFNGFVQLFYLAGFIIVAFFISFKLTLLILLIGVLMTLIGVRWLKKSYRLGNRESQASRDVMFETHVFLGGLKTAQVYGAETAFLDRFETVIDASSQIDIEFTLQQARLRRILELFVAVILIIIFIAGYFFLGLTSAALLAMAALMIRMAPQLMGLIQGTQQMVNALPAYAQAQTTLQSLATETSKKPASDHIVQAIKPAPILFENIEVTTEEKSGDVSLLRIESLELPSTGLVLIDGPSGAGKSTFAELLCGLRHATAGVIKLADVPINETHSISWQNAIAFLPQEPFLFYGTLFENLVWPNKSGDELKIWDALKKSNISQLINALPKKLDEPVRDGGFRFSSGERQRLCLARTLLRDSWIYVLDEPTANLDMDSETIILRELKEISKSKLIVLISHNPALKQFADQKITIQNGQVSSTS